MTEFNPYTLPISEHIPQILSTIQNNKVTIIKSPTGTGKSTLLPLFLPNCALIEPRRLAVQTLYKTLKKFKKCSYIIRFEKEINKNSEITIMTDGMFLRTLNTRTNKNTNKNTSKNTNINISNNKNNDSITNNTQYDYIILDEVHERSINIDLILLLINTINTKFILMSATVDTKILEKKYNAAVVDINVQNFTMRMFYEDEAVDDFVVSAYFKVKEILHNFENIKNTKNTDNKVENMIENTKNNAKLINYDDNFKLGDILIFLPGIDSIDALYKLLRKHPQIKPHKISSLNKNVFTKENLRNVYISTNITESSITIPNVNVVIDCGLYKNKVFDGSVSYFGTRSISRDSAKQRAGRCNRTGIGICYRLYTKKEYQRMKQRIESEILRCDLRFVVLYVMDRGFDIFDMEFVEFPRKESLILSIRYLLDIKCIEKVQNNEIDNIFEGMETVDKYKMKITKYGKSILRNPFDVNLSHFYEVCKKNGIKEYGAAILSLISQENLCLFGNSDRAEKPDLEQLLDIFIGYRKEENKSLFCRIRNLNEKMMEQSILIYEQLCKNTIEDTDKIEVLERCFSIAFSHNLSLRQNDGSYKMKNEEIVYIHPSSAYFKKRVKKIVFVDVFCIEKKYVRVVGKLVE